MTIKPSVADPDYFNADPHSAFRFDADTDPGSYYIFHLCLQAWHFTTVTDIRHHRYQNICSSFRSLFSHQSNYIIFEPIALRRSRIRIRIYEPGGGSG